MKKTSNTSCKYGCDGSGVILVNNDTAKQCKCVVDRYKKKKMEKMLHFADIPERYRELRITDFEVDIYTRSSDKQRALLVKTAAINFIKNYEVFAEQGKGLYMYSRTPGSGKSRMAMSIANGLIESREVPVKYVTTKELIMQIQDTFNNEEHSQTELLNAVKEVEVLILDEIGVENVSKWVEETIYLILNERLQQNKITIFTSNVKVEDLDYQRRTKSRISKMVEVLNFPEEDIRLKKGDKENSQLRKLLYG